jgi:hypothetical protein
MKVLVCGSRKWVEQRPIEEELRKLPPGTIVIHGACRGADNIAGYVAKELLGFEVRPYPADWDFYGPAAGVLRNQKMLDQEHTKDEPINLVLAFHEDPGLGKGTKDMVERAQKADIEVRVLLAA